MEPNPVGQPDVSQIQSHVDSILELWKKNNPDKPTWWSKVKGGWVSAVNFLLKATDYLIRAVEKTLLPGPDKKATVLKALSDIYDIIVPSLMPITIRPFNSKIKDFVINVVATIMIDFIVSKYKDGIWTNESN